MSIELPADGLATVAGIDLPAGRRLGPDPSFVSNAPAAAGPVLWATDEVVVGAVALWASLAEALEGSGLVPVLLDGFSGDPRRPWDAGEFDPGDASSVEGQDPAEVLGRMWEASVPSSADELSEMGDDLLAPYALPFPGLAGPTHRGGRRVEAAGQLARSLAVGQPPAWARIGLVVAVRPADVLAAVGWQGPVNYGEEPSAYSAVLRSWEDRFGASLFRLGFDTLELLVESPPARLEAAVPVAAEQFALCPDSVYQGVGSIGALAAQLVDAPVWSFWWD